MTRGWLCSLCVAQLALATGCADDRASEHLSAVLVTLDTTRADALGCYGRVPAVTPNLDRLAREGVLFERAYSTAPITLPSHASMLTGLYPIRHTVRHNGLRPLPQSARTLAEAAREAGFETAAFVASVVLADSFGLDQGFDLYDEPRSSVRGTTTHFDERPAGAVIDAALAWLERRERARPFFLWVHLFDPHAPYTAPAEFRSGAFEADPYVGELAYADRELGRLLDALREQGLLDRAAVLAVADHGEAFGEHGELSHGTYCYESTLRVPLILRLPSGARGVRESALASVVDVFPTLCDAMGLETGGGIDGESLLGEHGQVERGLYFESYYAWHAYGWSPLAGWLDADAKYLHSSAPELYDLAADPAEARDLSAQRDLAPYRDAIAKVAARPALVAGDAQGIDEELQGRIRALGYAGVDEAAADEPHPLESSAAQSPARMNAQHRRIMEAMLHANEGRTAEASARYLEVLAVDPANPEVLELASACLIQERRYAEAVPLLERIVASGRGRAPTHYNLALALWRMERPEEAVDAFLRARELAPGEARVLESLVQLLRQLGRESEARAYEEELSRLRGS